MKETKIEIEIPNGKTAKWVNNVLTLVDEKPQNVMERIKTFDDALAELRDRAKHGDEEAEVLVNQYDNMNLICSKDFLAYIKLCVIASALNEGWKHKFLEEELRWYPWFRYNSHVVSRDGIKAYENFELVYAVTSGENSYAGTSYGSRLAFKSKELAEYAGKQFIDIYVDYLFQSELLHINKPREIRDLEPLAASKNEVGTKEKQIKARKQ